MRITPNPIKTTSPTCSVAVQDDKILLRSQYEHYAACKSIPGGRWSKPIRAWTYPATAHIAKQISDQFQITQSDTKFAELVSAAEVSKDIQKLRTRLDLPDISTQKTPPWNHQKQAYWFATELPAVMLAMDMGTGKSKVCIDLIENNDAKRVLILCPRYVVPVWTTEFQKHATHHFEIVCPAKAKLVDRARKIEQYIHSNISRIVVVQNYEAIHNKTMKDVLTSLQWDYVILDESHRIKAPGGKTSRWIGNFLRPRATRRVASTGTPMPNTPADIYAQYRFLDPGIFGTSFVHFKTKYLEVDFFGKPIGFLDKEQFEHQLSLIAFRVSADDVLDLPDYKHVRRTCRLEMEAMEIYESLRKHMAAQVNDGIITTANAIVKLLRLRQLTGGWVKDEDGQEIQVSTAKAELFTEIIEDLPINEPIVVFAAFHRDIDSILSACLKSGRTAQELSGRCSPEGLQQWQDGKAQILVAQIDAAREGIDCTRAHYAIYYSLGYSPGVFAQSMRRLLRPGQEKPVTYIHLVAEDTVDDVIYKAIEDKADLIQAVLNSLIA